MIPGCERIDASIDANVANEEIGALDQVRYLINRSPAETTGTRCHRRAPSLPSQRHLAFAGPIHKWGCDPLENATGDPSSWVLRLFVFEAFDNRRSGKAPVTQ